MDGEMIKSMSNAMNKDLQNVYLTNTVRHSGEEVSY